MLNRIADRLLAPADRDAPAIFCKALVAFAFVKVLVLWPMLRVAATYQPPSAPDSMIASAVFAPSLLAANYVDVFQGVVLAFLLWTLLTPWTYVRAALFFWVCLNLYRVYIPLGNGADIVLLVLACWAVLLPRGGRSGSSPLVTNTGVLLCQVQVVVIYFLSGWSKLASSVWRSGEAAGYIAHLQFVINPWWYGAVQTPWWQQTLSALVIGFELAFGLLVWIRATRKAMLIAGTIFHAVIAMVLSLPDFSLIMILSYTIFLTDNDYRSFRKRIGRLL